MLLLVPSQLDSCNEVEEIIALIRVCGLDKIADRLLVLREYERDLEDDQVPISFGSRKRFARFVITERSLADPRLGVSPDGNVQAEWHCGRNKRLATKFLENGMVRFAVIAPTTEHPSGRMSLNGEVPAKDVTGTLSVCKITDWAGK